MADQPDLGDSPPPPPDGASSPHDAVFRRIFSVPANAASELRAVLPPSITARLEASCATWPPRWAPTQRRRM